MKNMHVSSRTEAQQRADAIRVFRHELQRLEQQGVFAASETTVAFGRRLGPWILAAAKR